MQICITLYIFSSTVKAQICTHTFNIYIHGIFLQNFMLQVFKIYGHLGMKRCLKNTILLLRILKNGIHYKIKRFSMFLLKFGQNTYFDSENMFQKLNFQNFQIWTPTKKNLNFPPIPLIFDQKVPNRDSLIFFHTWNLLAFKIYVVHLGKISWL